jgi:Coenzyme PQQ synthesis protein D (PqqD)
VSHRYIQYRQSPDVLFRDLGEELLVTAPTGTEIESLQGSAVAVWETLGEGTTYPDLLSSLSLAFSASIETIEDDVKSLLDDFLSKDLVEALAEVAEG